MVGTSNQSETRIYTHRKNNKMASSAHVDAMAGLPALDRNDACVEMGLVRIHQRIDRGGALDPPPNTPSFDDPLLYTIVCYGAHHLVDMACAARRRRECILMGPHPFNPLMHQYILFDVPASRDADYVHHREQFQKPVHSIIK